jgi:lysyl-tRNA synthetase, class II
LSELEEQVRVRRQKRDALERAGVPLYPNRFASTWRPAEVHRLHGDRSAEELEEMALTLAVPGRVTAIREHGKLAFVDLSDGREKLQLFIRRNQLPEGAATVLDNLDLGDVVGASGTLMRTRHGELSLMVDRPDAPRQGAAPAAREVARPGRRRGALPPALPRPGDQPGVARCSRRARG